VPMAQALGLREASHGWIWCRETLDMSGAVTRHPATLSGPAEAGLPSANGGRRDHDFDDPTCSGYLARVIQNPV
jgi:hypothetical protein